MNDTPKEQPEVLTKNDVAALRGSVVTGPNLAKALNSHEELRARCAALTEALRWIESHANSNNADMVVKVAREALAAAPAREEERYDVSIADEPSDECEGEPA